MSKVIYRKRRDDDDENQSYQSLNLHGLHGNMDEYAEQDGYFGSISPFYGDLPEEVVDTEAIDKEFQARYDRLITIAKKVLTPDQFRIFDLCFVKYQTQETAAEAIGVSQPYVAKACKRILEILKLHEGEVF